MASLPAADHGRGPHRHMTAQDSFWLDLDRPENRMAITSVLWTATPIDPDRLRTVIAERLLGRYPVYSQHPVRDGMPGSAGWRTDTDFDLARHVIVDKLPEPGTRHELQDFVAAQRSRPFDLTHPLWSAHLLQGYGEGSALVLRSHHAMADGIRLTQVMFSLFDLIGTETTPPKVGGAGPRRAEQVQPAARLTAAALRAVGDLGGRLREIARRAGPFAEAAVALPVLGASAAVAAAGALATAVPTTPRQVTDAVSTSAMTLWNSVRSVVKLAGSPAVAGMWIAEPGIEKTAVWGDAIPLEVVKRISAETGTTVNDVCVTLVTGAVGRYLAERGAELPDLAWMIPVSLEAFDAELPTTLGNHFSLVLAQLPSYGRGFRERLAKTHRRIARIRDSYEPILTHGIQQALSQSPAPLAAGVSRYFADKAIGVLTNVPGPPVPMEIAGARVVGVVGWAPCSGSQAITVCVFSYAGDVFFGFGTDRRSIPDPERLISALDAEIQSARS
ncbi:WS/DGAT domain-containing protein [Amycolatopsis sp. NPDC059657]|uniref:WS/DGAT domain-containing protein n=1 Tax=Amycolatopsis sp. NPDC059657 TaxID=3346899 RepID=UPI00367303A3